MKLTWLLARLAHGLAGHLADLAGDLSYLSEVLYRPLTIPDARKVLCQADEGTRRRAMVAVRRGLKWGLLCPAGPLRTATRPRSPALPMIRSWRWRSTGAA